MKVTKLPVHKFKYDNGSWRSRALFVDIVRRLPTAATEDDDECPYWLNFKDDPNDPRPCLREEYVKLEDPTGYKLASMFLGGWLHFQKLLKCEWFKKAFDEWQDELFMLLKSRALVKIQEIAETEGASALAASKYLANGEYRESVAVNKRGRPSKEELKGELKRQVQAVDLKHEDFNRMTALTVVQGGKK